jgi:hypothetical protein
MVKRSHSPVSLFLPILQTAEPQDVFAYTSKDSVDAWPTLSSSASPPLDFLADDDPFANLSVPARSATEPSPSQSEYAQTEPRGMPRSPLADNSEDYFTAKRSSSLSNLRSGTQSACDRPAFPKKPSLISLNTLSRADAPLVVLKVRLISEYLPWLFY